MLEEFFDGSNCWLETIKFTVIPETLDYPLQPSTGRILRLDNVLDQNNVRQAAIMPEIGMVQFLYPYSQTQPMTATVVKTRHRSVLVLPAAYPGLDAAGARAEVAVGHARQHDDAAGAELFQPAVGQIFIWRSSATASSVPGWRLPRPTP